MNNGTPHEISVGRTVIAFAQIERMLDCIVGLAFFHGGFPKPSKSYPQALEPKIRFVQSAFTGCGMLAPFAARGEELLGRVREVATDRHWLVHAIETAEAGRGLHLEMLKYEESRLERVKRKLTRLDLTEIPDRARRLNNELGELVSDIINAAPKAQR